MVIFSHAKDLGKTDSEQKAELARMLSDPDDCPEILTLVLKSLKGKNMVLESVMEMEQGYHTKKSEE